MNEEKRILLTGISGFIGTALSQHLTELGYEVWGISRKKTDSTHIIQGDLCSLDSTREAISKIPKCQTIIHAAALAHSSKAGGSANYIPTNQLITTNLIDAIGSHQPRFIFLSSVSVYGEDKHHNPIEVTAPLRPSTLYGKSKLLSEEIIRSRLTNYHILRLASVYDEKNRVDIQKRVYLPGQKIFKLILIPSPHYSFCHLNTLKMKISEILGNKKEVPKIQNVADLHSLSQNTLSKQFHGIPLPCPVSFMMFFYYLCGILPMTKRYYFRCLFWKLFKNNVYR